jgi:hypothetical protein
MCTRRKLIVISLLIPIIFVVYYIRSLEMDEVMNCFAMYKENISISIKDDPRTLEVIFKAKHKPLYKGKSIFFLETHINKNKTVSLSARQACSVESAGK